MMAANPQTSLPKQCGAWAELKAAYRLLSNPSVDPQAIQGPHRRLTRQVCEGHPVVLCVQDDTDLVFTGRSKPQRLGLVGNKKGQGVTQHTTLGVLPDGRLLGILDQCWFTRVLAPEGETRRERQSRWCESQVWSDAARAIGPGPTGTRFVHVADRAGDCFDFLEACNEQGVGVVVRAMHDRRVEGATAKLWAWMDRQPVSGEMTIAVSGQRNRNNRVTRKPREGKVSIRYARVQLEVPWNHSGHHDKPISVYAVYVREESPPKDIEPTDWMLLTSEPVEDLESAKRIVGWYQRRWVIEEWHRVIKEGCRLEASQLDDVMDIQRLAAIVGIVGVRMIQLRDLAGLGHQEPLTDSGQTDRSNDPEALRMAVPKMWLLIVSRLARVQPDQLTPRQFWRTIAKRGGWIGRTRDGRPGWKVIWRGWYDIHMMVQGAELHANVASHPPRCG